MGRRFEHMLHQTRDKDEEMFHHGLQIKATMRHYTSRRTAKIKSQTTDDTKG